MFDGALDRTLAILTQAITGQTRIVILVFLLLTAAFAGGLGDIESEEGVDAFADDVPAQDALDRVTEEFEPSFDADGPSTQLIQRGENVLSREGMIRILTLQDELESREVYRVRETSSVADGVLPYLDANAETREEQIRALEFATDSEVRQAVRAAFAENTALAGSVSDDFSSQSADASGAIATVTHEDGVDEEEIQLTVRELADGAGGDITVFGAGILDGEFENVVADSLILIIPVVIGLILLFLIVAYRDPIDLALGLLALIMTMIWTFGFTGYAGLAFSEMMIAIPPLLLAIGIDFGIHSVNRYREERVKGADIEQAMTDSSAQLVVAFFIVTVTTVIGFGANITSDLAPVRDFGFAASVGILFTFLIFGVFLPAAKVEADRLRERFSLPAFGTEPLGSEDSRLGELLPVGVRLAKRGPLLMLLIAAVVTAGAAGVAMTVDTTFDEEDFLPPEDVPGYVEDLPEPFAPEEYTATPTINYLEANFEAGEDDEITIFLEGPIHEDWALESVHRAGLDPPDSFVTVDGQAEREDIVSVMHRHAANDPEFAQLLEQSDRSGNGIPDYNVERVLEAILASPAGDEAREFVSEDLQSVRVLYTVEADASQEEVTRDAEAFAENFRLDATATGDIVVFQEVADIIFSSSIVSLILALGLTAVFLVIIYHVLERRAMLGVANLVPIIVTVAVLGGTMPILGIPLNALTGTVLAITIGVGVAYSVHVTHRFIDEYNTGTDATQSLFITLRGTGGALTGSMLTTLGGAVSLTLAITPILGQFGFLMGLSVVYSYLMAIIVLPPTLLVWDRWFGDD